MGGVTAGELAAVRGRLEAFADDIFASLPRTDQRARGECYLRGLMLDGRRKSIEPMAARLGYGAVDLTDRPWVTYVGWNGGIGKYDIYFGKVAGGAEVAIVKRGSTRNAPKSSPRRAGPLQGSGRSGQTL